ncbi:MAG: branched-chain amino acid ABC transporter permease [Parvibaculaceae bacterium]
MTKPGPAMSHWLRGPLTGTLLLALPILAVAFLGESVGSLTAERVVTLLFINIVLVVGMQCFIGLSGFVSLGHVAFMAIGAYVAAVLATPTAIKTTSIPDAPAFIIGMSLGFVPAIAAAVVFSMAVALVIGIIIARLSAAAAPIATLSWMIVVSVFLSNMTSLTRGDQTFYGIPRSTHILAAAAAAILAVFVARCLRDSSVGLALRSSRKDELAARANGVDVPRVRLAAWVVSAGIVAAGGALYAQQLGAISPKLFLYDTTFLLLAMVVIGGRSISGAVVGVALVTVVVEILKRVENKVAIAGHDLFGLANIGLGLIIVVTMVFHADGIMGRWEFDEIAARRKGGRMKSKTNFNKGKETAL